MLIFDNDRIERRSEFLQFRNMIKVIANKEHYAIECNKEKNSNLFILISNVTLTITIIIFIATFTLFATLFYCNIYIRAIMSIKIDLWIIMIKVLNYDKSFSDNEICFIILSKIVLLLFIIH